MTSYSPADLAKAVQARDDEWQLKDSIMEFDRRQAERFEALQRQLDAYTAKQRQWMGEVPAAPAEPEVHEEPEPAPEAHQEAEEPSTEDAEDGDKLLSLEDLRNMDPAQYAELRGELGPGRARANARGILDA